MVENKITSTRPYHDTPSPARHALAREQQMRQIAAAFPVGTIVQCGPFVETNEPEFYEVIAYDERADSAAKLARADDSIESVSWNKSLGGGGDHGAFFVACRLLKTPWAHHKSGRTVGQPPATLTPINGPEPQPAPIEGLEAALDAALDRNKRLENTVRLYTKKLADERDKRTAAYDKGVCDGRQMERERIRGRMERAWDGVDA